jgi:hypothetical protein
VNGLLRSVGALFGCLVTLSVSAQNFYEARFLSGVTDFNRGAYARAVDELRVAAFGRVDDVARYEVAEIYLVIANHKLDRVDDSRLAALKVVQAEQVSPVYTTLDLARDIRASFEAFLPSLLSKEQLSHVPAFERFASRATTVQPATPRSSQQPKLAVPTPTKAPNIAVTVGKNDEGGTPPPQQTQTQQPHLDYGKLALDKVAAGDEAAGRRYAEQALADDDTNVNAHTALARIAGTHSAWSDVAAHYAVVRTTRRLTDDESAAYVIALAKTGHVADALGVGRGLPPAVLSRNDVRQALQAIEPSSTRQPVAPQPVSPMPVTVAPMPAPAPIAAGSAADSITQSVPEQIAVVERMLGLNNIVGARNDLRRITAIPNLQRSDRLALARALSQTALYAESSSQYRKTYPLKAGEESHMFYEAVNRYQIGDYDLARQLMIRALLALPQTPAILAYRDRILSLQ